MRQALPKARQMDLHASPLHEVQTKAVDGQLSDETGNVRQEARAGASAGFHFHHHEKVVGMIPHSIRARDRKRRLREEATCRGSPGARKPHAGQI